MSCDTVTGCVAEDSTFSVMLRLQVDGSNATQSALSSITWKAWNERNVGTVHASGTLTVSSVVFDTLQTDGRWTADTTGYNFRHDITQATFTDPGRYVIEYTVTMTGGNSFIAGPVAINVQGRLTDGQ